MSCDIHFRIEYKPYEKAEWHPVFGYHHEPYYLEADYNMFAALANVRNYDDIEHIELKGFPNDVDYTTAFAYGYKVTDSEDEEHVYYDEDKGDKCVGKVLAQKWVDKGWSEYIKTNIWTLVSDPDAHSPNWCTVDEYRKAMDIVRKHYPDDKLDISYHALLALMETYEKANMPIRLIYWFDN